MRKLLLLIAVLAVSLATIAAAQPAEPLTIRSVTPADSSSTGGTIVHVRGTGFEGLCICSPPRDGTRVFFGETEATTVEFIDSGLLEVVAPPHFPGVTSVSVVNQNGDSDTLSNAFTFTGDPLDGMDAFLFPIFSPPLDGAFGSRFVTTALVKNASAESSIMNLYGVDTTCFLITPVLGPEIPRPFNNFDEERTVPPECSTWTGRLFYVPKEQSEGFVANIRVSDVSRQAESHGVEIPVVPLTRFQRDRITLIGVPSDPRFRQTLRIYSVGDGEGFVNLRVDNGPARRIDLAPGRDLFEPAVAVVTDFPSADELQGDKSSFRITIDNPRNPDGSIPEDGPRIWAFVSVTNNDTQEITTITPRR